MRKNRMIYWGLAMGWMMLMATGCSENESAGVTLDADSQTVELYSIVNQDGEVKFKADGDWKASSTTKWLTFSPKSGKEGSNTITVTTTSTNRTKNTRMGQLTIESGGKSKTVTIRQRDDYAIFESDELNLGCQATTVGVRFWTNQTGDALGLYATGGLADWIKLGDKAEARTRTEYEGYIHPLQIMANDSRNPRNGAFFLTMKDKKGDVLPLDTLFVYQEGSDNGIPSDDYSEDGKVELLNKATEGKGIPIVLMGDGFIDQEIADSSYARTMRQTMENLFSEEPIRSLREYFNVYQVTTVSPRQRFGETALMAIPDHQSMGVSVDADAVMRYVKKVENIDSTRTLAVVILNTSLNKGVTYMMRSSRDRDYSYAIALCPVIDSLKSEAFRQVLTHEAIGHGFAKLADEYVRSTEGSATDEDISKLKEIHERWNWYMNVDSEKDSAKVVWNQFIYDNEFANEKIGTYEGGYTFYKGVYRPTEESMMRANDAPFNAPSRQAIYNRVMKMALDKTPTYEEFVAFDRAHKPATWSYRSKTRQGGEPIWLPAPPRIIWKD